MKRALLTVSFGTSYPDTRRQTIESIEQDLQKAFPDRLFARAWSSSFLRGEPEAKINIIPNSSLSNDEIESVR